MKIILNDRYGGYAYSQAFLDDCEARNLIINAHSRTDPEVIALLEEKGSKYSSGFCSTLTVCEYPDEATDYYVMDYDGLETLAYVLDGKIYLATGKEV